MSASAGTSDSGHMPHRKSEALKSEEQRERESEQLPLLWDGIRVDEEDSDLRVEHIAGIQSTKLM